VPDPGSVPVPVPVPKPVPVPEVALFWDAGNGPRQPVARVNDMDVTKTIEI
jgi:hypothetical protein